MIERWLVEEQDCCACMMSMQCAFVYSELFSTSSSWLISFKYGARGFDPRPDPNCSSGAAQGPADQTRGYNMHLPVSGRSCETKLGPLGKNLFFFLKGKLTVLLFIESKAHPANIIYDSS